MLKKKEILVIKAGGTICQRKNKRGILEIPKDKNGNEVQNYLPLVPEINEIANITETELEPIDSTNMTLDYRKKFVEIIRRNYQKQDGFVIIQGTDTLAPSAVCMNYMVQNLGKPIIFTGAQKSIYEKDTDAIDNVLNSVKVAIENIGETAIVFDNRIIRGSRSKKRHSKENYGFYSPNAPLLGKIKKGKVNLENQILRDEKNFLKSPKIFTDFKKNIFYYQQISGSDTNILEKVIQDIDSSGIIIGGYGTGNINSRYLKYIEKAIRMGKPVAITTNCEYGGTEEIYKVGAEAIKLGAFLTYDMTTIATFQKMMYSLGVAKSKKVPLKETPEFVKEVMQNPIGEDITKKELLFE
ncbi:MAG: asparaginase [Nanoarchaeota archaeon]|nr:asparaginase [Nanoarchaeota archaeon]